MIIENDWLFLIGRVLYGGVLTIMALDGFRRNAPRVEAARSNGVPLPDFLVPFATGLLFIGGIGIMFWFYPQYAATAVALFFIGVTPLMHAFWKEEPEDRRGQRSQFFKNTVIFSGALLMMYIANLP